MRDSSRAIAVLHAHGRCAENLSPGFSCLPLHSLPIFQPDLTAKEKTNLIVGAIASILACRPQNITLFVALYGSA